MISARALSNRQYQNSCRRSLQRHGMRCRTATCRRHRQFLVMTVMLSHRPRIWVVTLRHGKDPRAVQGMTLIWTSSSRNLASLASLVDRFRPPLADITSVCSPHFGNAHSRSDRLLQLARSGSFFCRRVICHAIHVKSEPVCNTDRSDPGAVAVNLRVDERDGGQYASRWQRRS